MRCSSACRRIALIGGYLRSWVSERSAFLPKRRDQNPRFFFSGWSAGRGESWRRASATAAAGDSAAGTLRGDIAAGGGAEGTTSALNMLARWIRQRSIGSVPRAKYSVRTVAADARRQSSVARLPLAVSMSTATMPGGGRNPRACHRASH
jgi:hypothetical protein